MPPRMAGNADAEVDAGDAVGESHDDAWDPKERMRAWCEDRNEKKKKKDMASDEDDDRVSDASRFRWGDDDRSQNQRMRDEDSDAGEADPDALMSESADRYTHPLCNTPWDRERMAVIRKSSSRNGLHQIRNLSRCLEIRTTDYHTNRSD